MSYAHILQFLSAVRSTRFSTLYVGYFFLCL